MAYEHLTLNRPSKEEMAAAREEAKIRKQAIIAKAISDGAAIHYYPISLIEEERETLICMNDAEKKTVIHTSIQKDMTKLIAKGWKITSITYRRNGMDPKDNTAGIIEMSFVGPMNGITYKLNKSGSNIDLDEESDEEN